MSLADDDLLIDGLRQRAQLFERILADLLGPQTILQLLPTGLIAEPALSVGQPPEKCGLRAYAADLVWCPDRVWRVAGDHLAMRLLEAPVLAGFLPSLCRFLLGELLRLASSPSRWLADAGALQEIVLSRHRWAIVDAFRSGSPAVALATLSATQRIALQERVDAEPSRFAARMLIDAQTQRVALTRTEHGAWRLEIS